MTLKIQFTFREGVNLETIVADASVSETHSFGAQVTDFPVEKGADVSDNIRAAPVTLSIDAFISDFPLSKSGFGQSNIGVKARQEKSTQIVDKLRQLQTKGVLVNIETGLRQYENMALESLDIPRDKSLKNGVRLTLKFKEVRVVKTQSVRIQAREAKGQGKVKDGNKSASAADAAIEAKKKEYLEKFNLGRVTGRSTIQ